MVEVVLGLLLGAVLGFSFRRWGDTRRAKAVQQALTAPATQVPVPFPAQQQGGQNSGASPAGGGAPPSAGTGAGAAQSWRAWVENFAKQLADDPPSLLAALVILMLVTAYAAHLGFILTLFDYQSLEETFLRFAIALVIGYIVYLISYLVGHPDARRNDIPEGVQVSARNLGIAALLLTLVLVLYLKPSQMMREILGRLEGAEILGVKVTISSTSGPGTGDKFAMYRGRTVASDSFVEAFSRPMRDLRAGVGMLEQVRDYQEMEYYDALNIRPRPGISQLVNSKRVFQKVFHPAAGCLYYLGSRRLLSTDIDHLAAKLNLQMREFYREIMFKRMKSASDRSGGRFADFVYVEEEMRKSLIDAIDVFLHKLSAEWTAINIAHGSLFGLERGNWGTASPIDRAQRVGSIDDGWQACNVQELAYPHLRRGLLDDALRRIDARRVELPVMASFLSLFIGDRPHAIQRLDVWAESVFYPEVTGFTKSRLSKKELRDAAKAYCGKFDEDRKARARRLVLCLSYLRMEFFKERILALYSSETPKQDRIRLELFDSMSSVADGLYRMADMASGEGVRNACWGAAPQNWRGECPPGAARLLRSAHINRNNVLFLRSKLSDELSDEDLGEGDSFCELSFGPSSGRLIKTLGLGDRMRMGEVRSALADTCARWELKRTEHFWLKELSNGEAKGTGNLRDKLVKRLKEARARLEEMETYWIEAVGREEEAYKTQSMEKTKNAERSSRARVRQEVTESRQLTASIFQEMESNAHASDSLIENRQLSAALLRTVAELQSLSLD